MQKFAFTLVLVTAINLPAFAQKIPPAQTPAASTQVSRPLAPDPSKDNNTPIMAALIGAVSALAVVLLKDILIEGMRIKRRQRRELLDRKLSELYGPLWITSGAGSYMISNVLSNDAAFENLIRNYHLLSPNLANILNEYLKMTQGNVRSSQMSRTDAEKAIHLSIEFSHELENEINELKIESSKTSSGSFDMLIHPIQTFKHIRASQAKEPSMNQKKIVPKTSA